MRVYDYRDALRSLISCLFIAEPHENVGEEPLYSVPELDVSHTNP